MAALLCSASVLPLTPAAAQTASKQAVPATLSQFIDRVNRKGPAPGIAVRKPPPLSARTQPKARSAASNTLPIPAPRASAQKSASQKVATRVPGSGFTAGTAASSPAWQAAAVEIVAAGRGRINYEAGVIKAIGLGAVAPPTLKKSRAQDLLDARDAAVNDAIRSLGIAVSQVRVNSDTRVSNYVMKSDDVRLRVEGVIKNAEVVEEKMLPKSGVYQVVVQAKMSGPNSLLEAIDTENPRINVPKATPLPPPEPPNPFAPGAPAPEGAEYTSLIVDCRGLRVAASMSPRLMDSTGQEIYGTMNVATDYLMETGIAAYPRSASEARQCARAGRNPLIVRAIRVADDNRNYPVIAAHDAARVYAANRTSRFLERTAVIFLIDP